VGASSKELLVTTRAPQSIAVTYKPINGVRVTNEAVANIFLEDILNSLTLVLPGTNFNVTGSQV
jgi:hypothetical protein